MEGKIADVNGKIDLGNSEWTALGHAVYRNCLNLPEEESYLLQAQYDIVKLLLENNARPDARGFCVDLPLGTPLQSSAHHIDYDVAKLLIEFKASVNPKTESSSPLMGAVYAGRLGVVRLFLEHGATKTASAQTSFR